ncbi:MAG: adenosine deaminase [Actinomycetia bacterium]|nr:adenosine deaminase [Actinomycetes bacterium]
MRDLQALPKAHLHLHLEAGMRPSTLVDQAERYGIDVPAITGFGSFTEFSGMYLAACQVLQRPEDFARVIDEIVEDARQQGATYIEPSFYAPRYSSFPGATEGVVEMVLDQLGASAARHGVAARLMLAADRTMDPSDAVEQAKIAVRFADRGIVAFGLANDEALWPPEPFAEAFAIAKEGGLLSTPHAGELAGPESVRGALDTLHADRVQHGVRAIEDPELVKRLADEGVCCDVCPTSNVLLAIVPTMEASALGPLLDAGVPCSVNADDPLLFGPGLLEEYEVCRTELGFDDARMAHIARCSIEHSGAPADVKASALSGVDAWLAS